MATTRSKRAKQTTETKKKTSRAKPATAPQLSSATGTREPSLPESGQDVETAATKTVSASAPSSGTTGTYRLDPKTGELIKVSSRIPGVAAKAEGEGSGGGSEGSESEQTSGSSEDFGESGDEDWE